jgi:hypothetical protein
MSIRGERLAVLVAALAIVFVFPMAAEACTATMMINKGNQNINNPQYPIIQDVIESQIVNSETDPHAWTKPEAFIAAAGTVLHEWAADYRSEGPNNQYVPITDAQAVIDMLSDPTHMGNIEAPDDHRDLDTVRDHVVAHGDVWDSGWNHLNGTSGAPLPGWYYEQYPDNPHNPGNSNPNPDPAGPLSTDHAG